jgi:hypothetical protein
MVDSPHVVLRVIVVVHFILTVWASMSECLFGSAGISYVYMHCFILAVGLWAIICPESADAIFMFLLLLVVSILMDIIFIGIYATLGQNRCDATAASNPTASFVNTYRFSLGMSILNLLLKPLTSFIVYRLYQDRTGQTHFPQITVANQLRTGGYSNIDQQQQPHHVETATPYSTVDKSHLAHQ